MEDLGDPLGDRVMKNVPMIAREPLKYNELFTNQSKNLRIFRHIALSHFYLTLFSNQISFYFQMAKKFLILKCSGNTF